MTDSGSAPSKTPFFAAFGANVAVAAAKFFAALQTGSSATLAEGFHTSVDAPNNLLMLIADGASLVVAYREFKPHQGRRGIWRGIRTSKDPTNDVQFSPELGFPELAQALERLEAAIRRQHAGVKQIFIEARAFRR